tara:strand:+ start:122 stop:442 length:321 start_codon:yes stop_codon:yes gene_type:complete
MQFPLIEAMSGLLAAVAAYYSIRAKKEAGEANKAVNHTEPGQPRLYDIALNNATNLATIKERQRNVEATVDKLSYGQDKHAKTLAKHSKLLKTHGEYLENLSKTND